MDRVYYLCYPERIIRGADRTVWPPTSAYHLGRKVPIQSGSINTNERGKLSSLERRTSLAPCTQLSSGAASWIGEPSSTPQVWCELGAPCSWPYLISCLMTTPRGYWTFFFFLQAGHCVFFLNIHTLLQAGLFTGELGGKCFSLEGDWTGQCPVPLSRGWRPRAISDILDRGLFRK